MLFLFYDIVTALLHWKCCAMSKRVNIISYHITLLLLDVRAQIQLRSEYLFLHLLMLTSLCTRLTTIVQLRYVAIVLSVQSQNFNGLNRCDMCVEKKTWISSCSYCKHILVSLLTVFLGNGRGRINDIATWFHVQFNNITALHPNVTEAVVRVVKDVPVRTVGY